MKEIFEKIKERLERERDIHQNAYDVSTWAPNKIGFASYVSACKEAIRIVNQVAEEYGNDGWIPVSSGKLPDTNEAVNITWVNRKPPSYYADIKDKPFTATGHYHNGRWYWYSCVCKDYLDEYGDSIGDRMDGNIEVIAWQPLPAPYQPEGEE